MYDKYNKEHKAIRYIYKKNKNYSGMVNSMSLFQLTAHHGTERSIAYKIQREQHFLTSEGDQKWLGDGAYFFENNPEMAREWSEAEGYKKRYSHYGIVEAQIETEVTSLLDLDTPMGREEFHMARLLFTKKLEKESLGIRIPNSRIFDGKIINDLCCAVSYRVVVQSMFVQLSKDRKLKVQSRVPNCRVISVREPETCIKSPRVIKGGLLAWKAPKKWS